MSKKIEHVRNAGDSKSPEKVDLNRKTHLRLDSNPYFHHFGKFEQTAKELLVSKEKDLNNVKDYKFEFNIPDE
eukprot:CAMPEP_0114584226 /NCGR_PEP_ID=MMETSP0125-20121206/7944_1 /TAXON_ID=485358 ORGANISM="Aristerostoma sp., Strain ATCC 50986" /NCGR_SAMPLE_ID=MMETSP0125 /ASSEMBLY_ACC=CAM_ASM_000245 /LENGTH=72 /DNA_ID=CAMNT_0001778441 /DNA_START=258 /DNA_END=476 /DNA_ORIENTATION=-